MNRYSETPGTGPQVAAGWQLSHLAPPSGLFGANGMQFGPDGWLYVVQVFGSQVSTINTGTGGAGPDSGATVPVCRARGR